MIEVSRVYGVRPKVSRGARMQPALTTHDHASRAALTASESDTAFRRFTQQRTHVPPYTRGCAHLERRRRMHSAARSTCAAVSNVRSSPLGADTVCKSRNSSADVLFKQQGWWPCRLVPPTIW